MRLEGLACRLGMWLVSRLLKRHKTISLVRLCNWGMRPTSWLSERWISRLARPSMLGMDLWINFPWRERYHSHALVFFLFCQTLDWVGASACVNVGVCNQSWEEVNINKTCHGLQVHENYAYFFKWLNPTLYYGHIFHDLKS